jgi:prepilin-type processing-associated H-X9-DG protein
MPDSYGWDVTGVVEFVGAPLSRVIKKITKVKNTTGKMLFIDEGWATPDTWTIFYNESRWLDIVPERHGMGTNFAFLDGHSEYWKWTDPRTREFARAANELDNPNDATGWMQTHEDNEDIRRLVTAVWGTVGW